MAQRISRKELKHDEIRDTLVHGAEAVASHQQQVWLLGAIAAIIVIAVFGWRYYTQNQTTRASAALADASKIYEAGIRTANEPPADPNEITYVDEKNKYSDAAKKFTDVANRFHRTRPGLVARYYAALSLEQLDRYDEAEKDLKTVESSGDEALAALSRFQLAQVYDKAGKAAQAVQLYEQLADKPSLFVPKPVVLLTLAGHYSASDPAKAAQLYNQVKSEYPDTDAAQEADQHLQLLPNKG